jgi:mono/diheme cytochrome c family protein
LARILNLGPFRKTFKREEHWRLKMLNTITRGSVLLTAVLFLSAAAIAAQEGAKAIKTAPMPVTSAASGEEMFNAYCAVCHGKGAKGDGPAATEFKRPPTNLTLLAKHFNGKFPEAYVAQVIQSGPRDAKAHGSKDMPVWGTLFAATDDTATVKQRIYNLTKYIETLQAN